MSGQEEITRGLNPPQLEAVTYGEGPLLVLAGAGSGKTRVLTSRVAYLIGTGRAAPEQILAVTFTNKAAGEMKQRIERLTGIDSRRMQVSTFHSFGARVLRYFGERIGIPGNFTIYDEDDSLSLIKNCIEDLGLDSKTLPPKVVKHRISDAKSEVVGVEEYHRLAGDFITERIARVYERYQQRLAACGALDFDDLLTRTVTLIESDEVTRRHLQSRYKYLLIDEYQDTNRAQYLMAQLLAGEHLNLFAVGDDDQSIYGWRGANINNILDFEKDFPSCKVIRMEQNYRSTKTILAAAAAVIANNRMRKGKTLFSVGRQGDPVLLLITDSDRQEAEEIAELLEQQVTRGTPRREMAILYRTNAQSRVLEESLKRRFIPYQIVGGVRFYQRKEIKDLLAYLRLLNNPRDDVSFRRIINYPKRGIGAATLDKLGTRAQEQRCSLLELLEDRGNLDMLSAALLAKLGKFSTLMSYLKDKADQIPLEPFFELVAQQTGLIADLQAGDPIEVQSRTENVEELASSAGEYQSHNPEATLNEFLEEISLYTDVDDYNRQEDAVTLMTLHAAKGLEFESVIVSGLEEGLFPLARCLDDVRQLEEERRLMYVGMTRARSQLTISYAQFRVRFGERLAIRSRFVDELPDELVETRRQTLLDARGVVNLDYEDTAVVETNDPYASIKVGSVVYHPRWGEGKITNRAGIGEATEFEIRFTYAGAKKVLAKYAKLRLVR